MTVQIFDGHNDVLTRLDKAGGVAAAGTFLSGMDGQLDLPKARAGGFGGGFFAIWIRGQGPGGFDLSSLVPPYDVPLPAPVPQPYAWEIAQLQAALLHELDRLGALRLCTDTAQIIAAQAEGKIAAILHLEGAEPLGPDLAELDRLYDLGLRSLGPVWSRPTDFGHGVPFRYPSDSDIGPGLSPAGQALVEKCNALNILIDLSHLNAAGFADVARISNAPLVATHSNAHAVSPHARNLTDDQLAAIARSGGVVGLNFECSFLRPDGRPDTDTPPEVALAHLDHLLNALGEEGVALGSDFDGCRPPVWLNSADKLGALVAAMAAHGYDAARIERICWGNWMRVLKETWGA